MYRLRRLEFALALAIAAPTLGAPILDGVRDAGYGTALSVQTVQTQFGDNFSELNAAYAQVEGGTLYLLLTGNLERNFNKLNIFLDAFPGGQNVIQPDAFNGGSNPENDNWANKHAGFKFDAGFAADYIIVNRNGFFGLDQYNIDFAVVGGGAGSFEAAIDVFGGTLTGSNAVALPIRGIGVAFDNSNTAGISGGTGPADAVAARSVATGIELAIPLAAIGNPVGEIKVCAMINASNHDFLSNQFLGGLAPSQGNLGGDGAGNFTGDLSRIDLTAFSGDQFFTVRIPTISGDFNQDGTWDANDLDQLSAEIAAGTNPPSFDLNGDGLVNLADLQEWLVVAGAQNLGPGRSYLVGDANLDGVVDGVDFIIWNGRKFTTSSRWSSGDFNADGVVDGQDFIIWNSNKFRSS